MTNQKRAGHQRTTRRSNKSASRQNPTKKKRSVSRVWQRLKNSLSFSFSRDRAGFIVGTVLLLLIIYSSIALGSFFFSGGKDQSVINGAPWADILLGRIDVANKCGPQGVVLSDFLFNRLFGFGIVFLFIYIVSISLKLMGLLERVSYVKRFLFCASAAIWFSLFFGWLQGLVDSNSFLVWGGLHGQSWALWLSRSIGSVGFVLLLLALFIVIAVLVKKDAVLFFRSLLGLKWIKRRKKQEKTSPSNAEADREEENVNEDETPFDDEEPDDFLTAQAPPVSVVPPFQSRNEKKRDDEMIVEIAPETEMVDINTVSRSQVGPGVRLAHFRFPSLELLKNYDSGQEHNMAEIEANKQKIISTLDSFKLGVSFHKATIGPTVTLYEVIPDAGIKISRIRAMEDDIAMSLKSEGVRIIAPMPGKGTIGIEVPNSSPQTVSMRSVLGSKRFEDIKEKMALPVALGKTITNEPFIFDLAKMPHLLIAGATGQGKSVGLNALITSLLYSKRPEELKFVLVDPKMLEFSVYEGLQNHYLAKLPDVQHPIITDMSKVVPTLNSLCIEMDNRYRKLTDARVRNIKDYNEMVMAGKLSRLDGHDFMPYIVLIVDEYADLIMNTNGKEAETPITRIAQKARAAGIHMVIATQRPSSDIITGVIKANFPARIAFKVFSQIDSRVILDSPGANQLVGRGDLLFYQGKDMLRLQCAFVDTPESEDIVECIEGQESFGHPYDLPEYIAENDENVKVFNSKEKDALFEEVARMVVNSQIGSTSNIQRRFNIGYNRAGRLMDQLEAAGIVSPQDGSKPRDVLVSNEESLARLLSMLD